MADDSAIFRLLARFIISKILSGNTLFFKDCKAKKLTRASLRQSVNTRCGSAL